jgi:hypothetical protein
MDQFEKRKNLARFLDIPIKDIINIRESHEDMLREQYNILNKSLSESLQSIRRYLIKSDDEEEKGQEE